MTIRLTGEQERIRDAAAAGGHLKARAYAGTGKTTTLKHVADALEPRRVLYVAFNRSTAEEAKRKFPPHAKPSTAHSLAFRATVGHFGKQRITSGVMSVVKAVEDMAEIAPIRQLTQGDDRAAALVVVQALTRWSYSAAEAPGAAHVPVAFTARAKGLSAVRQAEEAAVGAASKVWERMVEKGSNLPITHDFYLKYWALGNPRLPFDTILFDEAQDASPVMLGVVMSQDAQQIFCGDSHQQIYRFRGAVDAMRRAPGGELPLTRSWRFGPEIAEQANVVLGMLGEKTPLVGGGPRGEVVDGPAGPGGEDAVLCRGNAGVIREVLGGLDASKRVAVVGGTREAARLLGAAYELFDRDRTGHPELGIFGGWSEFEEFSQTEEGGSYGPIVRTVEEHAHGTPALCRRLEHDTVRDERDADLLVSTAHKAKGREWGNVRFCDDFSGLVGDDDLGRPRLDRDEANLVYVSVTRAMGRLNLAGYAASLREDAERLRAAGGRDGAPEPGAAGPTRRAPRLRGRRPAG